MIVGGLCSYVGREVALFVGKNRATRETGARGDEHAVGSKRGFSQQLGFKHPLCLLKHPL